MRVMLNTKPTAGFDNGKLGHALHAPYSDVNFAIRSTDLA